MFPPIFATCAAAPAVTALLGIDPVRLYPFAIAPASVAKPYAVWQIVGGSPENYLSGRPDLDQFAVQVDVYADSVDSARDVAAALRDAIEPHAYITAWRGESRETETKLHRYSFDVDWNVHR